MEGTVQFFSQPVEENAVHAGVFRQIDFSRSSLHTNELALQAGAPAWCRSQFGGRATPFATPKWYLRGVVQAESVRRQPRPLPCSRNVREPRESMGDSQLA